MKTALLIIDVQNDYFPNGKMELFNSVNTSMNIKELIHFFRKKDAHIIHIQHISTKPGASFFLPNTEGVEFNENVKPIEGEKIIIKNYPNSFRNTELNEYLKENDISKLIITGMMTHMCIDTTVRAAYDLGYKCILVSDCTATKSLQINEKTVSAEDVQNSFIAALNGTFSQVISKNDITKIKID